MINSNTKYLLEAFDDTREYTIALAERILPLSDVFITDSISALSSGGIHDYYSNGDYWWPNPETSDGLPYIQRDGESNPDNFMEHRKALRRMRTRVAHLTMAFAYTQKKEYAERAVRLLQGFFVDKATCMAPHLSYAQALPGICDGRGIGVIDTLHLVEIPYAIEKLHVAGEIDEALFGELKKWFSDYLDWLFIHQNGIDEMNTTNNHAICFFVQAASFARFCGNKEVLEVCRNTFKTRLLGQMTDEGSFPRELGRTKPYSYSLFAADNLVTLCQILSSESENLWEYTTENGASVARCLEFIMPFVKDKASWPYAKDVEHFDEWPARQSFMLFAGLHNKDSEMLGLYYNLPIESRDIEIRRNVALRQPILLLTQV